MERKRKRKRKRKKEKEEKEKRLFTLHEDISQDTELEVSTRVCAGLHLSQCSNPLFLLHLAFVFTIPNGRKNPANCSSVKCLLSRWMAAKVSLCKVLPSSVS